MKDYADNLWQRIRLDIDEMLARMRNDSEMPYEITKVPEPVSLY